MQTGGQIIKSRRVSLGLLLRQVAAYIDIDQAILSKIEKGERKPTKENIIKLAEILLIDEQELMIQFISDKIAYEILDVEVAEKALKVAEKKIEYLKSKKNGKS
jgi:transcriptional regulator with XRE-family HTH domain